MVLGVREVILSWLLLLLLLLGLRLLPLLLPRLLLRSVMCHTASIVHGREVHEVSINRKRDKYCILCTIQLVLITLEV